MRYLLNHIAQEQQPGGVVSVPVLRRHGITRNEQRLLIKYGELTSLRKGWFARPKADAKVVRAVRAGGFLGCVSALTFRDAWDPNDKKLHGYRTEWGRRQPPSHVDWCPAPKVTKSLEVAVVPVPIALHQAMHCLPTDYFLAVAESLIEEKVMSHASVEDLLGPLAGHLDWSQSGTETIARYRLRKLGLRVRTQVWIANYRVDLLVGERLVIEIDSVQHHTGKQQYEDDRRRDLDLRRLGYVPMRLTYHQVMDEWPAVEAAVLRLVRSRAHRDRTKS